ncbi:MAG: hypothetical protein ACFE94_03725 [Candidatus Hodarchaeota archaeon]
MLKKRQWLIKDEKMKGISPKKYYEEMFKELVKEINENEKSVKKFITIKN